MGINERLCREDRRERFEVQEEACERCKRTGGGEVGAGKEKGAELVEGGG